MKMSGEEIIAAPRQVVWDALNDPEVLKQCITGCEEIKKKSDTEMEAKVTAKVGPVKASFVGAMKLSKLNPPRSYVISGEGKGGMAGFAKGGATVQLSDTADGQTKLSYDVDAQVGDELAPGQCVTNKRHTAKLGHDGVEYAPHRVPLDE